MIKKIGIGIAALLLVLVGVISMQPSDYHVERSMVIGAKPETIFPLVGDLREMDKWEPWAKDDPTQKTTFEGETNAVGGKSHWEGETNGKGTQTLAAIEKNKSVKIDLEFFEPMQGTATTSVRLTPEGEGTKVTWDMDGKNDFVGKAFSLIYDMDEMIGGKYNEGLTSLKGLAESAQKEADEKAAKAAEEAAKAKAAAEAAAAAEGEVAQADAAPPAEGSDKNNG